MKQLPRETGQLLEKYVDVLYRWNSKMNLTSYTRDEFFGVGLPDCVTLGNLLSVLGIAEFADIGTGYGMPGLVLKILSPGLKVHLIDASEKKIAFLEYVSKMLGVVVEINHRKLPDPGWNARFDAVVSKASMKEPALIRAASGILNPGGRLIYFAGGEERPLAGQGFPVTGAICYRRDNGTHSNILVREKHDSNDR